MRPNNADSTAKDLSARGQKKRLSLADLMSPEPYCLRARIASSRLKRPRSVVAIFASFPLRLMAGGSVPELGRISSVSTFTVNYRMTWSGTYGPRAVFGPHKLLIRLVLRVIAHLTLPDLIILSVFYD